MLSDYDLTSYVILGCTILVYTYTAVSAFSIRRRLSGALYRAQALGIGLVSVLFGILITSLTAQHASIGPMLGIFFSFIPVYIVFLGTFFWLDTSIRSARLTDPLLRDSFRWSRLRTLLWLYNTVATILAMMFFGYIQIAFGGILTPQTPLPAIFGELGALLLIGVVFAPVFITLFCGFVVFPIVVRRSRDRALKAHGEWFGVFAGVFFFATLASVVLNNSSLSNVISGAIGVVIGYFLYRSAKSLVPMYSFSNESRLTKTNIERP